MEAKSKTAVLVMVLCAMACIVVCCFMVWCPIPSLCKLSFTDF